jgi:acetolactate decarboxylase
MNTFSEEQDSWVKWVGAQREVLQGDISGHVALASISGLPNLYALGPAEGLRGEVSIFDSISSIARIIDGTLRVERHFDVSACFLVFAQVSEWRRLTIETAIMEQPVLEDFIAKSASDFGVDVNRPFPFLIDATPTHATFHVLDKRDGLPHTPELLEKAKVRFVLQRQPVEVIGFYSNRHRGIFTPADANIHMHFRTQNGQMSGHLEKIQLQPGATFAVPQKEDKR